MTFIGWGLGFRKWHCLKLQWSFPGKPTKVILLWITGFIVWVLSSIVLIIKLHVTMTKTCYHFHCFLFFVFLQLSFQSPVAAHTDIFYNTERVNVWPANPDFKVQITSKKMKCSRLNVHVKTADRDETTFNLLSFHFKEGESRRCCLNSLQNLGLKTWLKTEKNWHFCVT